MNTRKNIAVYPGSFDPVTSGHVDIITRAAALYDELIVLVGVNSAKQPAFTHEERMALLSTVVSATRLTNVRVACFSDTLLVDYVEQLGAGVVVKGLRAVSDFEYEFQMAQLNRHLNPAIETVFMMTSSEFLFLSSSIVKEIAHLRGDITGLVPECIRDSVLERLRSGKDGRPDSSH